MSDVSLKAITVAEGNAIELNCKDKISIKHGSLFLPWSEQTFDVIVNDVSGVSNLVPFYKDWFKEVPCETGIDGIDLFLEVISNSRNYLNKDGKIISALISLSNVTKAYSLIKENQLKYQILGRYYWTREIKDLEELDKMINLRDQGKVDFKINDKNFKFYTEILEIGR